MMKTLVKSTDVQTVLNRMLDNEDANYVFDELVGCDMSKDSSETIEEEFHAGLNYMYDVLSSNEYNGKTLLQKVIDKDKDNVHSSLFEYEGIAHIIVKY